MKKKLLLIMMVVVAGTFCGCEETEAPIRLKEGSGVIESSSVDPRNMTDDELTEWLDGGDVDSPEMYVEE